MITTAPSPFAQPITDSSLCIILDDSFDPKLSSQIAQTGDTGLVSLLLNTPYAGPQPYGPMALRCSLPSEQARYASDLLERHDAGCLWSLPPSIPFEQGVAHWRSLLTVRTDEVPAQMMRFFEPRWLEPLLVSLSETERQAFMGPFTDLAWRNTLGWRHYRRPDSAITATQEPGWLYLSPAHLQAMDQQRLAITAEGLAQDYRDALEMPQPVDFVHRQLLAGQEAGCQALPEFERWLRQTLTRGDQFWTRPPASDLLSRTDLSSNALLTELEQLA